MGKGGLGVVMTTTLLVDVSDTHVGGATRVRGVIR